MQPWICTLGWILAPNLLPTSSLPCPGGPAAQQLLPQPRELNKKWKNQVDINSHFSGIHLALERVLVLKHVDKLSVVDLKQHAGDLAGEVGEHALDEREQPLAKHLLLLLRRGRCKHRGSQRLLGD